MMTSFEIRQKFLDFFKRNGHTIVASSSLIPTQDPTILFTNAGMNQFKDLFLGKEKRSYVTATSSQKCVRAGGKHNDLDNVGFTERHLTFFEMLGNFSFGDYFKKEAIQFAWEFLTKDMGLPADKLYPSVFKDDNEAFELWHTIAGVPKERITKLGEKDNFWSMGDTGPCGPCTEIYVDRGGGCGQATCAPGCDCPRFTEIWNLVFMQFDRQANGELKPLAQTGVDTGMGLERLCMVKQGKNTVYDTDLFVTLINAIEQFTGKTYASSDEHTKAAFRVLCDHIRSSSLLIADGCTPSNDGRGYVLRKIIRRAALFAHKLTGSVMGFVSLVDALVTQLSSVYPELTTAEKTIKSLLTLELERFEQSLVQGQGIMSKYIEENKKAGKKTLSGEQIFKLYDTYGFPPELTRVLAHEQSLTLDTDGFEREMSKQQEQSGKKMKSTQSELAIPDSISTTFVGYQTTENTSPVTFVQYDTDHAWVVTQESPFYVESGGQVNDTAHIVVNNVTYPVVDLKKAGQTFKPAIAAKVKLSEANTQPINIGDTAHNVVDATIRANTVKNHTATHMLQAALLSVLGPQIKQAGSLVCADYLRFDFNHLNPLTKEEIEHVENLINQKILENIQTNIFNTSLEDAKSKGIISFFGEKYNPEDVRVVQIPGFSAELCGGTHASATGIIGAFKITSDTALSAGTRRLTAVTGPEAIRLFQQSFATTKKLGEMFKVKPEEVIGSVEKLQASLQTAQTEIKQLKKQIIKANIPAWVSHSQSIKNVRCFFITLDDATSDDMRTVATELERVQPGLTFIVTTDKATNRTSFLASVAKAHESTFDLKKLSGWLKDTFDWRGGGNASMIQGGGNAHPNLFDRLEQWLMQ